jgi:threonine dehydrogenase-like Zn-dependent dehydrogenase
VGQQEDGEVMRAFSLKNGELAVREVPRPVPESGQILVRTLACAICASDHHYVDHLEVARADKSGMRVDAPDQDVVMGHEFCAEIVEYGPDTEREWPLGTRITALPMLMSPRGHSRIIGMAPDACGGFGEYFVVNEFLAKPVSDTIPVEVIALNDAMAVGWYYTRVGTAGNPKQGAIPMVIGLGAIGMSCVAALKQRGAGPIVAADFSEARRALALEMGADVVVDPAVESPYAAWRRVAWGSADEVHDRIVLSALPVQVIYECVGIDGVLAEIVESCEIGTRIMSAGSAPSDTIPSTVAHMKGIALQFGGGPQLEDWYGCLELVLAGELDPRPLIGEVITLDELPAAFERARSSSAPIRIVYRNDAR